MLSLSKHEGSDSSTRRRWNARTTSIARRLVLGAGLWIAVALSAGGFVLAGLFQDHVERSFDARLAAFLDALIAVAELNDEGVLILTRPQGEPRFRQPYSGWYWQIVAGDGTPTTSRSLWDQTLALRTGRAGGALDRYRVSGPQDQALHVLQRHVTLGNAEFDFAVAVDTAEFEAEIGPFNVTLGWSLGVLWVGLVGAVLLQVRFGLRPLRRMHAALAEIRAGRASRLEGAYPAEIGPLAQELNALLAQNAAVVERARTQVGNLAHALKTPLTLLNNEAGTAEGRLPELVRQQVRAMGRWVDHYLARARTAASTGILGARTPVAPVVADLARTVRRIHSQRGLTVNVRCASEATFRGDLQDLEEMLGNLMDNACKWAASTVGVGIEAGDGQVRVVVEDDGPGLPAGRRDEALMRGGRLDEADDGSGLGLAIVRDIAELYGGGLELGESPLGGLEARLTLPAA